MPQEISCYTPLFPFQPPADLFIQMLMMLEIFVAFFLLPFLSSLLPFPLQVAGKERVNIDGRQWKEVDYEENVLIPHWENAPHTNQKTQNDEGGEAKDTRPLRYWEIDRLREQAHHWLTRSPST